ncbi:uncharacterized protein BDR25DRAFT_329151 [Lindgomyces ingoldianus]|uniref:Uncharacterized protein n=1 Tax=Lindgomyces ingoldianus TaxID=673940 RepID=A0ACB6QCF4_9PLEO|nr:uncharacterized protein BDR25DRAFT_329151 [Lindgomyces ingoldianus]KAF2464659.1 hypothetical protein BDR25DRAFT_329151 [Lindgomyces ingoldianus]
MPMLHYATPAQSWSEALPLGNGRLGAMLFGGLGAETLRLNEESVWYGGPMDRTPVDASRYLAKFREGVRRGRYGEVEELVRKRFLATPRSMRHSEPAGICKVDFEGDGIDVKGYERSLDLGTGVARVEYSVGGNKIRREAIATFVDNVIAIRIKADCKVTFVVSLTRMSDVEWETNEFLDSITARDGRIILHATPGGKGSNRLCLVTGAQCEDEGEIEVVGRSLQVTSSDTVVVLAAHTTYRHPDPEDAALKDVDGALRHSGSSLWERHITDWSQLYNRMGIQLYPSASDKHTDERLAHQHDPGLISLYHSYSRYLLLSSSRSYSGALPATLQGIWNPFFQPPWGAKYTLNINLQMNYWPVHTSNLSECELPLFALLERMAVRGEKTARTMYSCRGWCAHHNTDIWADTDTQDQWMPASLWPLGGAWLCTHITEHYQYTGNKRFLGWMFPVLEGCVRFLLDFLIEDKEGRYLVTSPSMSPENRFATGHGDGNETGVFCEGSTVDIEIIKAVLSDYLFLSDELLRIKNPSKLSPAFLTDAKSALQRLPPLFISPTTSMIQEWGCNDYIESEPGHRHTSHLFPLYPGRTITPTATPTLAAAARSTLLRRTQHGGGHTGWSRAWLVCLWARLRDPKQCAVNIEALLRDSTLPNMLDTHPPFQIDGNFGGAAGILECLVQSHEEVEIGEKRGEKREKAVLIRLLPSCPSEWRSGKVKGVRVRGGWEVGFEWQDGMILEPVFAKRTPKSGTCAPTLQASSQYPRTLKLLYPQFILFGDSITQIDGNPELDFSCIQALQHGSIPLIELKD